MEGEALEKFNLANGYYKKGDLFAQKATQDEISMENLIYTGSHVYSALLETQRELEKQTGIKLVGYSLTQTITALYVVGHTLFIIVWTYPFVKVGGDTHDSKAHKLKSEYKVPNNRYSFIKVRALARGKHWEPLRKYAKSEPDIGFKPFAGNKLDNTYDNNAL